MLLKLLGPPRIYHQNIEKPLSSSKHAALLCYLAYQGAWVAREKLISLLTPITSATTASTKFRQVLQRAKQLPCGNLMKIEGEQLYFSPPTDVQIFYKAIKGQNWDKATNLYTGQLLEGFHLRNAPSFGNWLELERNNLHNSWLEATSKQAKILENKQQLKAAQNLLKGILEYDTLTEDIVQRFMRLSYQIGEREEALKAYRQFVKSLKKELNLAPLAETKELAAIITNTQSLVNSVHFKTSKLPPKLLNPPCIGRNNIIQHIKQTTAKVILIAGEPGVGKSRLMHELASHAMYLQCPEGLENVPYYPLINHLNKHLETIPELGKYRNELSRFVPEVNPEILPPPADKFTKVKILEAWARYLIAVSDNGEVKIDDLQWADSAMLELIVYLSQKRNLRLFVTYRSNEVTRPLETTLANLHSSKLTDLILLEPLKLNDTTQLLTSIVGKSPQDFAQWLYKYAGGNPFFTLETLKSLFEADILQIKNGNCQAENDFQQVDNLKPNLPLAIKGIISRRVDSLSEQAQRVLSVAAVMQENFKPEDVSHLIGFSITAVLVAFDELERANIVCQTNFVHDLLRQSVYENLSLTRCGFLHKQVAKHLSNKTRLTKVELTVIAEHWFLAGEVEQAAQAYFEAAAKMRNLGLYFEGISLLEAKLVRVPEGVWHQRCEAMLLSLLQSVEQADKVKQLMEKLLPQLTDPWALATVLGIKTEHLHVDGKLNLAKECLAQAKNLAPSNDYTLRLHLVIIEIAVLHAQSKYQEGIDLLKEELINIAKDLHPADYLTLKITHAALYDALGKHEEAQDLHLQNLQAAKRLQAPLQQVDAALNLLYNYIVLGKAEEGIELVSYVVKQNYPNSDDLQLNLAAAFRKLGRYQEALKYYQRLVVNSSSNRVQALALARVIMLNHKLGNKEQLEANFEKALSYLEVIDFPLALARLSIAVLEFGSSKYKWRVKNILQKVDMTGFPEVEHKRLKKLLGLGF